MSQPGGAQDAATTRKVYDAILGAMNPEERNVTPSPDSTMVAFTRGNDLWVR